MKTFTLQESHETLPKIESKETSLGRYYKSPTTGLWYPSVTTVTGFSKKEFFTQWRQDPKNRKESQRAANRGTQLHGIIEKYMANDPEYDTDVDLFNFALFEQIRPEVDKIDNIAMQEVGLWSDSLRMAGRVDCIAEYNGVLSVIDFKGSTKEKKPEWITNYFEQTATYALMYEERIKKPIKQTVILIACETGINQVFVQNTKQYLPQLRKTIDDYWSKNNFDDLQTHMNNS